MNLNRSQRERAWEDFVAGRAGTIPPIRRPVTDRAGTTPTAPLRKGGEMRNEIGMKAQLMQGQLFISPARASLPGTLELLGDGFGKIGSPNDLAVTPYVGDQAVEAPTSILENELVDRANPVCWADPNMAAFAPRLEMHVDVARNVDDSTLGGKGQRMVLKIPRRAERPGRVQPFGVRQVIPIGDREQFGAGSHSSTNRLRRDDLECETAEQ